LRIKGIIEAVLEQNEWATIRQLPDGDRQPIRIENREGQRLRVTVPPGTKSTEFAAGSLLEVQSEQFLYLGVILGWQDSVMLVAIEHTMDRTALEAIQNVWHGLPGY
jgi:hypothetical protein